MQVCCRGGTATNAPDKGIREAPAEALAVGKGRGRQMRRPAAVARSGGRYALLRHALNGDGAEFRVLVANLTGLFVLGPTAPGLCFFEAVPHLNGNAGRWWRSFK
jgi:hypothetical protein